MPWTQTTSPNRQPRARSWARWAGIAAFGGLVILAGTGPAPASAGASSPFRMIVNPSVQVTAVDRAFVAQAFLKKVRRWPNGDAIQPVDLDPRSPVRRSWSTEVLSRSLEAVRTYWQQMIFSGRELPPPELRSDEEVVGYVLRRPGAIGYVSARADLHGAKVLTLR
jgi:hypothetical protein